MFKNSNPLKKKKDKIIIIMVHHIPVWKPHHGLFNCPWQNQIGLVPEGVCNATHLFHKSGTPGSGKAAAAVIYKSLGWILREEMDLSEKPWNSAATASLTSLLLYFIIIQTQKVWEDQMPTGASTAVLDLCL